MYNFEQRSATYSTVTASSQKSIWKLLHDTSSCYNPISFGRCHGQIDFLLHGRKLHVVMYSTLEILIDNRKPKINMFIKTIVSRLRRIL